MKTAHQCQASRCYAPVEPGKIFCAACHVLLPHSLQGDLERLDLSGPLDLPTEANLARLEKVSRCIDLIAVEVARRDVINPCRNAAEAIRRELKVKGVAVE